MGIACRRVAVGVMASVAAGCAHGAATGGVPKTAAAPAHRADSSRAPVAVATVRFADGIAGYRVVSRATVAVAGDSAAHRDTVSTAAVVQYNARWTRSGLAVTGSVVRGDAGPGPGAGPEPVAFSATIDTATGAVRMAADSARCPSPNGAALSVARDFLAGVPRSLAPGASWTDTVTTVTCRGDIPVTTTAVRHFSVMLDGPVIVVAHTTAAELSGSATKAGVRIELTGHGDGSTSQQYQPETGRLLGGLSTVDIDLRVGTAGHPVELKQHAETRVKPLDL
jgi:hypothetical protein